MKRALMAVTFVLLTGAVLHAKEASRQVCPPGFSLVGDVCISDNTGDITLPETSK
jgi:hypothetical protein